MSLDAVLLDAVLLDGAACAPPNGEPSAPFPPPPGTGAVSDGALYAVGLKPMMLTRFRPLVPYFAVSLLLAVRGRLEHPTIPNKDALAVIQSNR